MIKVYEESDLSGDHHSSLSWCCNYTGLSKELAKIKGEMERNSFSSVKVSRFISHGTEWKAFDVHALRDSKSYKISPAVPASPSIASSSMVYQEFTCNFSIYKMLDSIDCTFLKG